MVSVINYLVSNQCGVAVGMVWYGMVCAVGAYYLVRLLQYDNLLDITPLLVFYLAELKQ